jgi:protein-disulfide isomerase
VWKHFPLPFHKEAGPAHVASEAVFQVAGSEAFWKFHDLAFENMRALTNENFEAWAVQAGADKEKFKAAFNDPKVKAKVDKDVADGKPIGVRGTPAFFVNGKFLSGARPQQAFEQEIDAELAAAKQLIGSGTPADQVYVALSKKNFDNTKAKADPAEAAKKPEEDDKSVWKVKLPKGAAVKGPATAPITIVVFSEYQCPFCARVLPTMKQIMDSYKDKVRLVFLDNPLPFHQRAIPASMLAHEAKAQKGMDGYWAAHDLLFENQKKLEDEDLWGYAGQLGLDVEKVKAAVQGQKYKDLIGTFQGLAGELNAGGTPHFFVNGRRVTGAQPFEKFKSIIDEELPKAEALLKQGIKAEDLYAEIIKNGKEPPPPEQKEVGDVPENAPRKGSKDWKVRIHEFSDFQCPFCSRVNDTMKTITETYGDKAQIVWRHKPLPFHKEAPLAHAASQEAYAQKGNDGFWKMHDLLFAGQKEPGLARQALDTYAGQMGLDAGKFAAALASNTHEKFITEETAYSDKIGVRGTPGFVIQPKGNKMGYFLSGAQPFPKFKELIDRALKEAK